MLQRDFLAHQLCEFGKEFPVVAMLGPRQVGKTTMAKQLIKNSKQEVIYIDLERLSDRELLKDAEAFFLAHRNKLVIIDEVQLMPQLFSVLRPEVDAHRIPGRFILTGSASPELVKGVSESLAGRIAYLDIFPITLSEALNSSFSLDEHWFRGGFPLALTAAKDESYFRWAENFIRSYVERDLSKLFGVNLSAQLISNFWSMIAHSNGNIWNSETYARSLGVSSPTVNRYLDFMEGAFLLRKLPAWFVNAKKRMVKSPKVYIRDSGILHYMSNIYHQKDMLGHPVVGSSWEGYVIEEICKQLPYQIKPYFYRTHNGAEVDLLLVKGIQAIACIEIKNSLSPVLTEGFYNCMEELNPKAAFVIYKGDQNYQNSKGVELISLPEFLGNRLKELVK